MSKRKLVNGNEAIGMGALDAGCRFYFGYPITPQNQIPEFMAAQLPKVGGVFLQAESEIASINMLMGAAATGVRVMTSSSSPGISLKQEGISYMAGSEIPGVIVNMSRSGPGLGGIAPSQGDYFQATRGGGHGDYRTLVLAPHSVQENYDLTIHAFDLADKYRNPVVVLGDAILGQIKEPVALNPPGTVKTSEKEWALTGCRDRKARLLKSLYLSDGELTDHNWRLFAKYERMKDDVMCEIAGIDHAELIVVAFGSVARIVKTSIEMAREAGLRVGLIRPITLFPFPAKALRDAARNTRRFLTIELNTGQMVEDVRLSLLGEADVDFYGKPPGSIPTPDELFKEIKQSLERKV